MSPFFEWFRMLAIGFTIFYSFDAWLWETAGNFLKDRGYSQGNEIIHSLAYLALHFLSLEIFEFPIASCKLFFPEASTGLIKPPTCTKYTWNQFKKASLRSLIRMVKYVAYILALQRGGGWVALYLWTWYLGVTIFKKMRFCQWTDPLSVHGTCCIAVLGPWGVKAMTDSRAILKNSKGKYVWHHDCYAKYRTVGSTLILFTANLTVAHLIVDEVEKNCDGVDFKELVNSFKQVCKDKKDEVERAGQIYNTSFALVSTVLGEDNQYPDIVGLWGTGEITHTRSLIFGGATVLSDYLSDDKWKGLDAEATEKQMREAMFLAMSKVESIGGPIEYWTASTEGPVHHSLDLPEHLKGLCPEGKLPEARHQINKLCYHDSLDEMMLQRCTYVNMDKGIESGPRGKAEIRKKAVTGLGRK